MTEIIFTSSVLILLLAVLRKALRGRISPGVQYALWLLAAARLLIPGTFFAAPVSVAGAVQVFQEIQWSVTIVPSAPSPDVQTPSGNTPAPGPVAPSSAPAGGLPVSLAARPNAFYWLDLVWKAGMVLTAGTLLLSNLLFYFRLRKSFPPVGTVQKFRVRWCLRRYG